jgi:hypothetical protein
MNKLEILFLTLFFSKNVVLVYEQDISDSVAQFNAMNLLIPTLATLRLSEDDSMTLLAKTAQHCSRVLKKGDQCALVALVSHLFQDPARIMECMQRAVRIASGMAEAQVKANRNPKSVLKSKKTRLLCLQLFLVIICTILRRATSK